MSHNKLLKETTISLDEAVTRTTLWRDLYTKTFGTEDPTKIFKGFRIPIADIRELAKEYAGENIQYVRAYISAQETTPPDPENPYTLSVLLVPVDGDENDILSHNVEGKKVSAIYDFTQPCPPCCDINSVLYTGDTGK